MDGNVLKFGREVTTLVVGDSHPMSSLNPSIIKGAINVSLDSENYFFTYYKIKHILSKNPQIRNLILGLSYHNISRSYEEIHLFSEDKLKDALDTYYLLLDDDGKNIIRSYNSAFIENYIKYDLGVPVKYYKNDLFIKTVCNMKMNKGDYLFLGNYYGSKNSNLNTEQICNKIEKYFYIDGKYGGTSKLMVNYLVKIIELCRNNGISIYLYNSPLHSLYKERIPLSSVNDYDALINSLKNKYSDVVYIDYSDIYLENKCFGDGDHVNSCGAEFASIGINNLLKKEAEVRSWRASEVMN